MTVTHNVSERLVRLHGHPGLAAGRGDTLLCWRFTFSSSWGDEGKMNLSLQDSNFLHILLLIQKGTEVLLLLLTAKQTGHRAFSPRLSLRHSCSFTLQMRGLLEALATSMCKSCAHRGTPPRGLGFGGRTRPAGHAGRGTFSS